MWKRRARVQSAAESQGDNLSLASKAVEIMVHPLSNRESGGATKDHYSLAYNPFHSRFRCFMRWACMQGYEL